ncbi:hypothetical protein [Primorskyibacter sp. S187A]|uniref:hypothetical protein n=1 Tax=Primorskyibacter sp. S187A TaxID=3415130 RepID=UPI003C7E3A20
MKNLAIIAALVLSAGTASALTQADITRYGIDASELTKAQKLTAKQVIHGGGTAGEVQAFIDSLPKKSDTRSN